VLPRAEGLSGGERRLLAVTRALLLSPSILLLDEPTTGIGAISRSELSGVLREACKGLTVLLVDHDMEFVVQFADQICCLENGVFVDIGPPADLAARPGLFHDLVQASREAKREASATGHGSPA
jgi:ABC-type multidrug transport system ATPase subunit